MSPVYRGGHLRQRYNYKGGENMCTAIAYNNKNFYFGRNLDYEFSYGESVVVVPRKYPFVFRNTENVKNHYAIIGTAHVYKNYPLFYDAANEAGLCMAGLNFVGNAEYRNINSDKFNVAHFEIIPWILSRCQNVKEAKKLLKNVNITNEAFNDKFAPSFLHWIISDKNDCITLESTKDGVFVYDNAAKVLTNNPPFLMQMSNLNNYMHLSAKQIKNRFAAGLSLEKYSRGMGAIGLPGDLSSQSRFVRAAFVLNNSLAAQNEEESVSQVFHILNSVEQVRGCCEVEKDKYEITIYSNCFSADKGIYYYTTYENREICAVDMYKENLESENIVLYPMRKEFKVKNIN